METWLVEDRKDFDEIATDLNRTRPAVELHWKRMIEEHRGGEEVVCV